jgi:hypothetical protein
MDAVTTEQKLALAVALSHEARRDGVVDERNQIETQEAVRGHTEMAARMWDAGYNIAENPLIALDLAAYDYAKSVGDMSLMDLYADMLYRSDGDFMDIIFSHDDYNDIDNIIIMPLGGGLTDFDKDHIKLEGGVKALMSLLSGKAAFASGIYDLVSRPGIDRGDMANLAGVVVDNASKLPNIPENAKNILNGGGLLGSVLGVIGAIANASAKLDITPTEYNVPNKSRSDMIQLEDAFLRVVRTSLQGNNNIFVNEGRSYNGSLGNLNVTVMNNSTQKEIENSRMNIMRIISGLREEQYKDIQLFFKETR